MAGQVFSNNAKSALAAVLPSWGGSATLVSAAGFAALSSGSENWEAVTLSNADESLIEIVYVYNKAGNVLSISRAQEDTEALEWPIGTVVQGRITKGTLDRFAQVDNGGDAKGQNALNLQPSRGYFNPEQVASGINAVAVGMATKASGSGSTAVGSYAFATGAGSLGVGSSAKSLAASSIALGNVTNRVPVAMMSAAVPMLPMADWSEQSELYQGSSEAVLCTPYFDLGVPATWAPNTVYHHGDIVIPPTPNGFQYVLYAEDDPVSPAAKLTVTSLATEPTWETTVGWSSDADVDGNGYWLASKPSVGYAMLNPSAGSTFLPLQFGFMVHDTFSTLTGTPAVSIGVVGDPTRYVNAQNVNISSAHGFYLFTGTPAMAVQATEHLLFTLTTAATAGRCVGRFFARGIFVELPDHA
jgi:hypothetical protein